VGEAARFVPVAVATETAGLPPSCGLVERPLGLIEIELPNGCRLRVDREVDGRTLRRVVAALGGR